MEATTSSINISNDPNPFRCLFSATFDDTNITNLPETVEPTWTVFAVVNGIASPLTIVLNFLIIWTILSDKNLIKVAHNILLVALAITDFLEGLIVEPLYCWYLVALIKRRLIPCQFTVYLAPAITLSCWTVNTLMVISVDLYLAVEHSQFYLEHVTTNKVIITTAVVWIGNITIVMAGRVLPDSLEGGADKITNAAVLVIHILVILFCTIKTQRAAYRQRRTIRVQAQAVQQNTDDENRQRQQYKHVLTMIVIFLAMFLFYCPYIITVIIQVTKGKNVTNDFQFIVNPIGVTFIHLQSLVDPIVISLRLSYIREGVRNKLLCRK